MYGAAKSVGKTFNQSLGIASSNGSCMGGQPARGLLHNGNADTVVVDLFGRTGNTGAARRGIELRGFHGWRRTGRQRGGTDRDRERMADATRRGVRADRNKDEERRGTTKGRGHAY